MPVLRLPTRRSRVGVALLAALSLAGCGADERPLSPVRVAVVAPGDGATVPDEVVELRGTVRPAGAAVRVAGREAAVEGRSWRAEVPLEPGANVLDVTASADGRAPAVTAVRVVREVPVAVPDVAGLTPDDARDILAARNLRADVRDRGGLLDPLIPGTIGVCDSDPPAGAQVRPGSRVVLRVARAC